ncbi:hypothetical protein V1505DRAFT_377989 [Lipomyces doorenjongii]
MGDVLAPPLTTTSGERLTTNGSPTASPRLPTCYWPSPWRRSSARNTVFSHSACILASSGRTWPIIWTRVWLLVDFGEADRMLGWTEFDFKPLERGVATHIYAAFYLDLKAHNDGYLIDSHVAYPLSDTVKSWATSKLEAKLSGKLVGQEFSY